MMPNEEQPQGGQEVGQKLAWCFGIEWLGSADYQFWITFWIILERIFAAVTVITQHAPIDVAIGVQISLVDLANVEVVKNLLDLGLVVDAEQFPKRIDTFAACSQDDLATRMAGNEFGNVVNSSPMDDPLGLGVLVVFCYICKTMFLNAGNDYGDRLISTGNMFRMFGHLPWPSSI